MSQKGMLFADWVLSSIVLIAVGLVGLSSVSAHESYHDPGQDGTGYCADTNCHPGFVGGSSSPLHTLHFGTSTSNCSLCHGGDPPLTMWSAGDADDGLGCAGCHGRNYGETIGGDYGGLAITGLSKASAYGLRDHHNGAGVTQCVACHGTTTVQAENVPPPYYSRDDVVVSDSCADGLDNDGDGLRDGDDLDCGYPVYLPTVMRQYP